MSTSAARTLLIPQPRAYPAPPPFWPSAEPDDRLDYSINVAALLDEVADHITTATFALAPSGGGELQADTLQVLDGLLTVWLGQGVPGRFYAGRFEFTTAAGRRFEILARIRINPQLAPYPPVPPPSLGYSSPLQWTAYQPPIPALFFAEAANASLWNFPGQVTGVPVRLTAAVAATPGPSLAFHIAANAGLWQFPGRPTALPVLL